MIRVFAGILVLAVAGCDAVTIAGTNRIGNNAAVSVGTTITPEGVQRPSGKLTVGLF